MVVAGITVGAVGRGGGIVTMREDIVTIMSGGRAEKTMGRMIENLPE